MQVVFTPHYKNPYQKLLADALKLYGVDVVFSRIFPKFFWLLKNRRTAQVIHIHWPSALYRRKGRLNFVRVFALLRRIMWAKIFGYHLVWTVHNILPHDSNTPFLDRCFRRFFVRFSDGIIGHCEFALLEIQRRFGKAKRSMVIPHGNYMNYYPQKPDRIFSREKLGISKDAFVLFTFGRLREYKGIESLIDQLILLEHKVTLVVAGKGSVDHVIQKRVQGTNVTLKLYCDFIPDDEVPTFFAVADVMVAPYVQVLTSGAIILGLSMGVPIIAPAIGCLPELVDDNVGILYDPTDPLGLVLALRKSLNLDLSLMSKSAEKKAAELEWAKIGRETAMFYQKIVNHE